MNRHIRQQHYKNPETRRWLDKFNSQNTKHKKKYIISPEMLLLIKYFITSYSALAELGNPYFRNLLAKAKYEAPSDRTFKQVLDDAIDKVYKKIEEKLNEAIAICLITDIWTNKRNEDFIAVSASLNFDGFSREVITIGMMLMDGSHTAENIQKSVEIIVNRFKINKAKINGIVSDEGSALVRLFKQICNEDLENIDLLELSEEERHVLGIKVDEFYD